MKKQTKITEREAMVLAAWFARSNMGQPRVKAEEVKRYLTAEWPVTLQSVTLRFCEQYMESDDDEQMWYLEARSWHKNFSGRGKYNTREAVVKTWPDVKEYFGW